MESPPRPSLRNRRCCDWLGTAIDAPHRLRLAGICLIRNCTGKDPVSPSTFASGLRSLPSTYFEQVRRPRALVYLLRQRHTVVLGVGMASVAALSALAATAALHFVQQAENAAGAAPLAPPAAPPAVPASHSKSHRHRFLATPFRGLASWYGDVWQGRRTASGEIFDDTKLTACHRTLPFGTLVRVTDTRTARSVVVKINDRGTLFPDRVIDLSSAAAQELGIVEKGLANVRLEVLGRSRIEVARAAPPAATEE